MQVFHAWLAQCDDARALASKMVHAEGYACKVNDRVSQAQHVKHVA